jgi:hypothetical protein
VTSRTKKKQKNAATQKNVTRTNEEKVAISDEYMMVYWQKHRGKISREQATMKWSCMSEKYGFNNVESLRISCASRWHPEREKLQANPNRKTNRDRKSPEDTRESMASSQLIEYVNCVKNANAQLKSGMMERRRLEEQERCSTNTKKKMCIRDLIKNLDLMLDATTSIIDASTSSLIVRLDTLDIREHEH